MLCQIWLSQHCTIKNGTWLITYLHYVTSFQRNSLTLDYSFVQHAFLSTLDRIVCAVWFLAFKRLYHTVFAVYPWEKVYFKLYLVIHTILVSFIGKQKVNFYFFTRPERYNQEVFICLPFSFVEGIVLTCNIDLYCVIAIFNGTGDMFNKWYFYTLNTKWSNKCSPRSLTHWCSHLTCMPPFQPFNNKQHRIVNKQLWATGG